MRDIQYKVTVAVRAERVDGSAEGNGGGSHPRHVATAVVEASCTCQSGAGGGCHHVLSATAADAAAAAHGAGAKRMGPGVAYECCLPVDFEALRRRA